MTDRYFPDERPDAAAEPAISAIERLLCGAAATGALGALQPRSADAWTAEHAGLVSLAGVPESAGKLKVCIATEEIVGPVRNGGIGTTYAALAEMLAQDGHDVTVLYLRGQEVEVETVDYWIADFAARGIRFAPVPDYAERETLRTGADRWLRAPYNMMRYLLDHPMDVVHVSEWRGSGYLSLLAKRQKIAFADTLFIVKTSSPWMWNRLYGAHTLDRTDDLAKITAERQSVELADMVIGGSLHLLRWMQSQGYAIPAGRTFVQPNVATFSTLQPLMQRRSLARGQRTRVDEIVFFGRLEARKGLFVFCQAIRRLIRKGVELPPRITFMGKPGAKMASHPDQTTPEYIQSVTRHWPTKVAILTEFQQYEAIEYLLGGARLAVMPSIIENSSMAIYEAAICGIPCVATDVGGNAELIHPDDRAHVLCEPHPVSLGDKVEEALRLGALAPRPSFDNDANLETWRGFHRRLAGPLRQTLLDRAEAAMGTAMGTAIDKDRPAPWAAAGKEGAGTSVCIYYTGDARALDATLASIALQAVPAHEVHVAVDGESNEALAEAAELLRQHGRPPLVVDAFDMDAGQAFNMLARQATGRALLFLWEGATLAPAAIATLEATSAANGAQVLAWMHRAISVNDGTAGPLRATILGSASQAFFLSNADELPLFVMRETFTRLDGFTADYRVLGYDNEFVARAVVAGLRCETVLLELGSIQARSGDWLRQRGYDLAASGFRSVRPELAAAPLAMRDILLLTRGLAQRGGGGGPRKAPDPVKKAESLLSRMMAGIGSEPSPTPAPPPRPVPVVAPSAAAEAMIAALDRPAAKAKPQAGAAARSGATAVVDIIDHYAGPLLGSAPAARKNAAAAAPARPAPPPAPPAPEYSSALQSLIDRRMLVTDGRLIGQFLGCHESHLWGWVVDGEDRASPVALTGHVNGAPFAAIANQSFASFAAVPPEARRSGFVIDLGSRRSRSALMFRVATAGDALELAQGGFHPPGAKPRACGVEGYCDPGDTGLIYGWAWYPATPERHVDVAVFVNGTFFARLRADRDREDLQQCGIGRGDYGFQIMLPRALRETGRHRVDVIVADTGIALSRSPAWVEGQRVEVTEPRKRGLFGR